MLVIQLYHLTYTCVLQTSITRKINKKKIVKMNQILEDFLVINL